MKQLKKEIDNMNGTKKLLLTLIAASTLSSCGGGGAGGNESSSSNIGVIENENAKPNILFQASSIDDYTNLRSQTDKFLDEVGSGLIERTSVTNNQINRFEGGLVLETDLFGSNQIFAQAAVELDYAAQSGYAEMGGFAMIDPDSLQVVEQINGELESSQLALDQDGFDADLTGELEYEDVMLNTELNMIGAFYTNENGDIFVPILVKGNLGANGSPKHSTEGIGLMTQQ